MAFRASRPTRLRFGSRRSACRSLSVASFAIAALLFALSPLSALWNLADAVRHGNVQALRDGMDWRALRVSLKGDLADVIHPPAVKLASAQVPVSAAVSGVASDDDLPEFGSSFVSNVVSNAVDDEVTPEHLLTLLRPDGAAAAAPPSPLAALRRIAALAFSGPDRFEAAFLLSDQPDAGPVRLTLRIERWHWRVVAVRLPEAPTVTTADARRT